MGVRERDAPPSQEIHVRSANLWMPTQKTDPIIQIVHRDEENVGRSFNTGCRHLAGHESPRKEQDPAS